MLVASIYAIVLGGYYLVRSLIARTDIKEFTGRGIKADSVLFFATIAGDATYQIYKEKLNRISDSEYDMILLAICLYKGGDLGCGTREQTIVLAKILPETLSA